MSIKDPQQTRMKESAPKEPATKELALDRKQRLAAELRANLKKRKAFAKARNAGKKQEDDYVNIQNEDN